MKVPRFKLDARSGTLRWRKPDGSKGSIGDRAGRFKSRAAQQVLAGTGIDFEVRKMTSRGRSDWQPLRMTYAEADELLQSHFTLKGLRKQSLAVRARREERGTPTFAPADYDRR